MFLCVFILILLLLVKVLLGPQVLEALAQRTNRRPDRLVLLLAGRVGQRVTVRLAQLAVVVSLLVKLVCVARSLLLGRRLALGRLGLRRLRRRRGRLVLFGVDTAEAGARERLGRARLALGSGCRALGRCVRVDRHHHLGRTLGRRHLGLALGIHEVLVDNLLLVEVIVLGDADQQVLELEHDGGHGCSFLLVINSTSLCDTVAFTTPVF